LDQATAIATDWPQRIYFGRLSCFIGPFVSTESWERKFHMETTMYTILPAKDKESDKNRPEEIDLVVFHVLSVLVQYLQPQEM
jgi:hypothetical protein